MYRYSFIFFLIISTKIVSAQPNIKYSVDLANAVHHELNVTMHISNVNEEAVILAMPNNSPGRYANHNFAKNVYDEKAWDKNQNRLNINRLAPNKWSVPVSSNEVIFSYTIFGNRADGTYLGVDGKKIVMNMPATFMYIEGLNDRPVTLEINNKNDWSIATQLVKENDSTFMAPNFSYFYDSPTIIGNISRRSWLVDNQTIEVDVIHDGTENELDAYVDWIRKIVDAEKEVFGSLPKFDFGVYKFLLVYDPWTNSDAMEHRNSTICTNNASIQKSANHLIGAISHEFFHCWNIERIRPGALEPFQFDQPNFTDALWFGEGFTNYYDALSLVRSGINSPQQFVQSFANTLNYVQNNPGRAYRGPREMSQMATYTDAGVSNDPTNFHNTFATYYYYGEVLALALDLELRINHKTSLDEYMKAVWKKFPDTTSPYELADLQKALAEISDKEFAEEFFKKYIYGSALPDYKKLFESVGIKLTLSSPESPYFNNPVITNGKLSTPVIKGTALYEAGIETGDKIIRLNNLDIEAQSDLNKAINRMEVGKTYEIVFEQMGIRKTGKFTTVQDPRISLSYLPADKLKKSQIKLREEIFRITFK